MIWIVINTSTTIYEIGNTSLALIDTVCSNFLASMTEEAEEY